MSDKTCQERVCNFNFGLFKIQNCIIADNHICAGGLGGKGPCKARTRGDDRIHGIMSDVQGDSGGALLAQDRALSGWSAVGLVSYQPGRVCGTDQVGAFNSSLLSLYSILVRGLHGDQQVHGMDS